MKKQVNDNTLPLLMLAVLLFALVQVFRGTGIDIVLGIAFIAVCLVLVGGTLRKAFKML